MHGDTDKEAQVSRGSLVSRSSLAVRCAQAGVSFTLSHRRRSQSCSYLHYALQCSRWTRVWHGGLAALAHAMYQYHVNGTDTVGRSMHMVP